MAEEHYEHLPTDEQVENFNMLLPLLESVFNEMKEFSKKKPGEVLNPLKVKMINRVLGQIKDILSSEPTIEFLDLLDDETLPTNSDAVLIIGQFRAAMDQFEKAFYFYGSSFADSLDEIKSRWRTKENP